MDPRTAAHVLAQIGALLELRGENKFKSRAYREAAKAVVGLDTDDLAPLYQSGALKKVAGVGPATLSVLADLVETGESRYLEQLQQDTPGGLAEMLRIPGLGTAKIRLIHERLGVETLQQLEDAARDGRLATLPRFGARTAEKILKAIGFMRDTGAKLLFPHALAESRRLLAGVVRQPGVSNAAVAGSVRRHREVVRDIDVVAACESPEEVATSMARARGVREVVGGGGSSVAIRYVDGTLLDLHCVTPDRFAVALWRATGSEAHERDLAARAASLGFTLADDTLRDAEGRVVPLASEADLYRALGCEPVPPELREGFGEIEAAAGGTLPRLLEPGDIRGVLHCHSDYSDGGNTIAELAAAAGERGWSYIGISDHSVSAFYAGGLSRDAVLRQHDEVDAVNESSGGVRVLKGIEADILADGRVDYDEEILDRFDYVIASIHSRFAMSESEMTTRVLRALEDPHLTILGHPTGRLLLTREPYAIDLDAVIEKAAEQGVALELNADPHRLDLDWRFCRAARERGVLIEIGPDAHSIRGLDYTAIGVGMARKGWLEARDVLNTRSVDEVLAFAARRRPGVRTATGAPAPA